MRDILYRGKEQNYPDRWNYGQYFETKHRNLSCGKNTYLMTDTGTANFFCSVLPETIGQYTGILDKNGKKIFEGDIVTTSFNTFDLRYTSCVAFQEGAFGLLDKFGRFNALACHCNVTFEVVGNIFDNPELLAKKVEV